MFDKNYYLNKKINLQNRRQVLCQKYIDAAFEYVQQMTEINKELAEIEIWDKQNAEKHTEEQEKVEPKKTEKTKK